MIIDWKTLARKDKTTIEGAKLLESKEFIVVYIGASFLSGVGKRNVENLKNFYEARKGEGVEVIYLSQDNNNKDFEKHIQEAQPNWLAVPPNTKENDELMKALENPSKPHVIAFNKIGIMCRRTTGTKDLDSKGILEKWRNKKENSPKKSNQVPSQESKDSEEKP
ncbi:unnamed protein product, partial [Mesorhabditis spiculigera]